MTSFNDSEKAVYLSRYNIQQVTPHNLDTFRPTLHREFGRHRHVASQHARFAVARMGKRGVVAHAAVLLFYNPATRHALLFAMFWNDDHKAKARSAQRLSVAAGLSNRRVDVYVQEQPHLLPPCVHCQARNHALVNDSAHRNALHCVDELFDSDRVVD